MSESVSPSQCYVIKAEELLALNYLPERHVAPQRIEWINRANDRQLSPSTLEQLLRTYHRADPSPSVLQLRQTTGVRAIFASDEQRNTFAREFTEALTAQKAESAHLVTAIFPEMAEAESVAAAVLKRGVPETGVSLLWRANAFMGSEVDLSEGHSKGRLLATITGGGIAGAALGVAILVLPGVGPVAATGAVLASAYSSVATASGIIGATGAAMATMLSDRDVDDYASNHLEEQLKKGRIFLSVDLRGHSVSESAIRDLMESQGGRMV